MLDAVVADNVALNKEVMAMNQELVARNQQLLDAMPGFIEVSKRCVHTACELTAKAG